MKAEERSRTKAKRERRRLAQSIQKAEDWLRQLQKGGGGLEMIELTAFVKAHKEEEHESKGALVRE